MQSRRWWRSVVVFGAAIVLGTATTFAAPVDPATAARDMEAAKGSTAVDLRLKILTDAPAVTDHVSRDAYGKAIAQAFDPLLTSTNPDAQLNAGMTIAQLQTLSTDAALRHMLTSDNAGLRYWGAKGLGAVALDIKDVGGGTQTNAIAALQATIAKEKSGIVKKEVIRSLGKIGGAGDLLAGMDGLATTMQASVPDQDTLEAATMGLTQLQGVIGSLPASQKSKAAQTAAWVASFASQQELALQTARKQSNGTLPEGYHATVVAVINNAMKMLNTLADGKETFTNASVDKSPEETLFMLNDVTGSASAGAGKVQKVFADAAVPPEVKAPK